MKTFLSFALICVCVILVVFAFFAFAQGHFLIGVYVLLSTIPILCLRAIVIASCIIKETRERQLIDEFTSMAKLGNDSAMYDLYLYYATGNLVVLDPVRLETYWLNEAAKAGNEEAKKRLESLNSTEEDKHE